MKTQAKTRRFAALVGICMAMIMLLSACQTPPPAASAVPSASTAPASQAPQTSAAPEQSADPEVDLTRTGGLVLPLVEEPVTITWMVPSDVENLNDLAITKEISRRTGITLNLLPYPKKSYAEKLSTVLGSGQLPDIVSGTLLADTNTYGQMGAFASITDYVDQLPNFKSLIADNPENSWVMYSWATDEGALYKWPIYGLNRDVNHGLMYRQDIFDELGIQPWKTTDEFYAALEKIKQAYPDSFPFSSKNGVGIFKLMARYWNVSDDSQNRYPFYYDETDGQWKFAGTSDGYKQMLDLMKRMYNNGLLDPEFLTDTQDSWSAKMTTERSFVTYDWIGRMSLLGAQVGDANPKFDLQFGYPIGLGKQHSLPKMDVFGPSVAKGKNELVALKLLDYLFSPEGGELMTLGIEGEIFNFDAQGRPEYPQLKDEPLVDIGLLENKYGMWIEGSYLRPDHRSVYYNFTPAEQRAQDIANNESGYNPNDPAIKLTDEETEVFADTFAIVIKELETFSAKYVTDKNYGQAQWDAFAASVDSMNVPDALKVLNDAQARFDQNQ